MGCPAHNADMDARPDPSTMTREDRAAELQTLMSEDLWCSWGRMHARVDGLVGRSVYTHEMASPDYLVHEILTGTVPTIDGIVAKFPPEMKVIVAERTRPPL